MAGRRFCRCQFAVEASRDFGCDMRDSMLDCLMAMIHSSSLYRYICCNICPAK